LHALEAADWVSPAGHPAQRGPPFDHDVRLNCLHQPGGHTVKLQNKTVALCTLLAFACTGAIAAPVQWTVAAGGNDHWYEIVSIGTPAQGNPNLKKTWDAARADALSRTHLGLSGYLATVTSAAENLFIDSLEGPFQTRGGWLGGSDSAVEGEWRWIDGPEAGLLFWQGDSNGSSPGYAKWGSGWPNEEDYVEFRNDTWASSPGGQSLSYYVEYSAAPPPPNGVPLPGTISMVALGLGAVCVTRRRRHGPVGPHSAQRGAAA
jgi:hypothetical protein